MNIGAVPLATDLIRHGDRLAIIDGAQRLTYAELAQRVDAFAALLGPRRTLVQLTAGNSLDSVIAYLAALCAGHPVLIAPGDNPSAGDAVAQAYRPGITVAGGRITRHGGPAPDLHPDLALLLSTSGSTGSPKLVRLSAANVQANAESIAEYLNLGADDRTITTLPMHYCYGLSVLHSYLLRGATVVLSDRSVTDPDFWRLVREERVTGLAGVPYTFDLFERIGFADLDLPHLRYLTQAGGRMAPTRVQNYAALGQRRGWDLYVMYGQTEATARMAYLPPELAMDAPDAIGRAIPGGRLRVDPVPDSGTDAGAGSGAGELVYTGPNVMMGYALTPADLALGAELAELRTGDLATCGEDGLFRIVGRRSRFAKIFGLRIDLQRVESALGEGLPLSCVGSDEGLAVIVEAPTPPAPTPRTERDQQLRSAAAAAAGLPESVVRVFEVEALPRTSSGKPDYAAMTAFLAANRADEQAVDKVDLAGLKELYASMLGVREVRDTDSFVSLGGDSLSYVRMSLRLEKSLGRLPRDWQNIALGEFDLAAGGGRRWLRTIEMSVLLRAVAILLVISSHVGVFVLYGGAHVLMAVAGFNFARFQLARSRTGSPSRPLLVSAARIAVPAIAWIGGAAWATGNYGLDSVLLVRQLFGPDSYHGEWWFNWQYWFIESIVYLMLGLAALFAFRRVDALERTHPLVLPSALMAVGLVLRILVAAHSEGPGYMFLAPAVLWLFALGWLIARCTTVRHRLAVTIVAVLAVPGFFETAERDTVLLGGLLLLLWVPTVRLPGLVNRIAGLLAGASLYIYLTQFQVYPEIPGHTWLAVAACVGVGLVYWQVVEQAERGVRALLARPRRSRSGPSPVAAGSSR
ncbi:AMP-binding protein [Tomitella biformata]|uniref:AMP-binding protein n=1 Tax=Tomitella biformata TaxID=630403 RepID=UPI000687142A|nr:AMP-binding protein [Tomitella biformata]